MCVILVYFVIVHKRPKMRAKMKNSILELKEEISSYLKTSATVMPKKRKKIPQYRHGKISQNFVQELLFRLKPIGKLKKMLSSPFMKKLA